MNARISALVFLGVWLVAGQGSLARAPAPSGFTLVVIPERANLVQAALDLLDKRPAALVTYRAERTSGALRLHGWTGERWVSVSETQYKQADFLVTLPERIILVGDDRLLPNELVEASDWGPMVMSIPYTDTDAFLNAMGAVFEFTAREWRWFASRYNMEMEDVTPERARISWYDQMSAAPSERPRRRIGPMPDVREIPRATIVDELADSKETAPPESENNDKRGSEYERTTAEELSVLPITVDDIDQGAEESSEPDSDVTRDMEEGDPYLK